MFIFSTALKPFFVLKYLNSLMRIWKPGWKQFGFGSVADPGCLSRIPDPDFYLSRIPDPGSKNSNKRER
jgi:hypothetical protein